MEIFFCGINYNTYIVQYFIVHTEESVYYLGDILLYLNIIYFQHRVITLCPTTHTHIHTHTHTHIHCTHIQTYRHLDTRQSSHMLQFHTSLLNTINIDVKDIERKYGNNSRQIYIENADCHMKTILLNQLVLLVSITSVLFSLGNIILTAFIFYKSNNSHRIYVSTNQPENEIGEKYYSRNLAESSQSFIEQERCTE